MTERGEVEMCRMTSPYCETPLVQVSPTDQLIEAPRGSRRIDARLFTWSCNSGLLRPMTSFLSGFLLELCPWAPPCPLSSALHHAISSATRAKAKFTPHKETLEVQATLIEGGSSRHCQPLKGHRWVSSSLHLPPCCMRRLGRPWRIALAHPNKSLYALFFVPPLTRAAPSYPGSPLPGNMVRVLSSFFIA